MADPTPLANKVQPGDVISQVGPDGVKRYKQYAGGGQWNDIAPPSGQTIGSPVRAITTDESKALETRRTQAGSARDLNVSNQRAIPASNRLNAGPYRGWLLDAAIPNPDNKGGMFDTMGAAILGPIAKVTGAISPQDVKDYQTVKRAQNQAVLAKQLEQKGPQTESDAARMAMTGVSVSNAPSQNRAVARQDAAANAYLQAKTAFETQWVNRYGLNGLDPQGRDVTTAFQQTYQPVKPTKSGVVIRRVN